MYTNNCTKLFCQFSWQKIQFYVSFFGKKTVKISFLINFPIYLIKRRALNSKSSIVIYAFATSL